MQNKYLFNLKFLNGRQSSGCCQNISNGSKMHFLIFFSCFSFSFPCIWLILTGKASKAKHFDRLTVHEHCKSNDFRAGRQQQHQCSDMAAEVLLLFLIAMLLLLLLLLLWQKGKLCAIYLSTIKRPW